MEGKCLTKNIVYQATVSTNTSINTYIGSTATEFKTRFNNHTASFRHRSKQSSTELSKYIWKLKEDNSSYTIKWRVIENAKPCRNSNTSCGLCLAEKYNIIFQPAEATLNDRKALISSCRHSSKYLLCNYKS